jgi:hypothetical protein
MDVLQEPDGGLAAADAGPRVKGRAGRLLGPSLRAKISAVVPGG